MRFLIFNILFFSLPLFAGYTQDVSSTTNGDNDYNASQNLLKLESTLNRSNLTLTVSKTDGSDFRTRGTIYFKVGSPETFGVDRETVAIEAGEYSKSYTHDMSEITDNWENGKAYYVRYENNETNEEGNNHWIWVGPITLTRHLPTEPTIDAPLEADVNEATTVTVTKGSIGDDSEVKVQCTASNSNYDDNAPFVSEYSSGGVDVNLNITFDSAGTQEIWCTSFDRLGLASEVSSRTIRVNGVEDNSTESNTTETNTTEVVNETAQDGFSYMFTPYRCFGMTPPDMNFTTFSDTIEGDSRVMVFEFDLSGGTQSCIDEYTITRELSIATQWFAKGAKLEDLTPSGSDIRYKKVRITLDNTIDNRIHLEVVTSLGTRVWKTIILEANNGADSNETKESITYSLNGTTITNENMINSIQNAITVLEAIKPELDKVASYNGDKLKQEYDAIKKLLDDAKKSIDDIKQAIDTNIADNDEKVALKKEADKIKKALDAIKKMIDSYKKDYDNSQSAIDTLKLEVDKVIAMMMGGSSNTIDTTPSNPIVEDVVQQPIIIIPFATPVPEPTPSSVPNNESNETAKSETETQSEEPTLPPSKFEVHPSSNGLTKAISVGGLKKVTIDESLMLEAKESANGYKARINDLMELLLNEDGTIQTEIKLLDANGIAKTSSVDVNHTEQNTDIDANETATTKVEFEDNRSIETKLTKEGVVELNLMMLGSKIKLYSKLLDSHLEVDAKGVAKLYYKVDKEVAIYQATLEADEYDVSLKIKKFDTEGIEIESVIEFGNILTQYQNPTLEIIEDDKMRVRVQSTLEE